MTAVILYPYWYRALVVDPGTDFVSHPGMSLTFGGWTTGCFQASRRAVPAA
jgi:hypothetical protein